MNEFDKEALLISLERHESEESRLAMAKRLLESQKIRAQELGEVLALLRYDSSRKELAEYAKQNIEDPENLPLVLGSFRLPDSLPNQQAI